MFFKSNFRYSLHVQIKRLLRRYKTTNSGGNILPTAQPGTVLTINKLQLQRLIESLEDTIDRRSNVRDCKTMYGIIYWNNEQVT